MGFFAGIEKARQREAARRNGDTPSGSQMTTSSSTPADPSISTASITIHTTGSAGRPTFAAALTPKVVRGASFNNFSRSHMAGRCKEFACTGTMLLTCCPLSFAIGFFCLLFVPGVTITNYQQNLARGVAAEFGEDGGLSAYASPVTVATVYHTNTVARQIAHVHHPHSPSSRMRVLREAQPVREAFDLPIGKPAHARTRT